ncbi:T9SS type A sorting domain-containing protein [Winogradskyella sp.]|uniref:T9SS type A sorting domain-containing protein n=1 Tax=Winogradskyella sp. TaxID=1883156 RepID=UPI003AB4D7AB
MTKTTVLSRSLLKSKHFISLKYKYENSWTGYNENIGDECILGIVELENVEINVFPNPVKDNLYISSNYKLKSVHIFNAMGQKVFFEENYNTNEINVSSLSKGVYFLKLTDMEDRKTIKRFITE